MRATGWHTWLNLAEHSIRRNHEIKCRGDPKPFLEAIDSTTYADMSILVVKLRVVIAVLLVCVHGMLIMHPSLPIFHTK